MTRRESGNTRSLRTRLVLSGLVGMLLSAVAVAALLGAAFERSVIDAFDRRLADDLLTIAGLVTADGGDQIRLRGEPPDSRYARALSGHYWRVSGARQTVRSRSLWDSDFPQPAMPSVGEIGIAFETLPGPLGQTLRIASREIDVPGVSAQVRISVASDVSETLADVARFRVMAGVAGALVAAALLIALVAQTTFGLRPLRDIAKALEAVRSGRARELQSARFPREIRPLADELNAVLEHNNRMVERARTGAGDLAHALKTPLSVMLAAADRKDAGLASIVAEQVARIRENVDRHLAISLPADRQSRARPADVTRDIVAMLSSIHAERALAFDIDIDPAFEFHGSRADLEDMLGNLLDNACKWARRRVRVSARQHRGELLLSVSDDGPGVPDAELSTILRRGKRLDEATSGSGLGLSIVNALADSYGGRLELRAVSNNGLHATLILPGGRAVADPGQPIAAKRLRLR